MKRIWFSAIFLLLIAGLCVVEQIYIKNTCNEMIGKIEYIQSIDKNENEKITMLINDAKNYWQKSSKKMKLTCDHEKIKEIDMLFFQLEDNDTEEKINALEESKALIKVLYDTEKLSIPNVI